MANLLPPYNSCYFAFGAFGTLAAFNSLAGLRGCKRSAAFAVRSYFYQVRLGWGQLTCSQVAEILCLRGSKDGLNWVEGVLRGSVVLAATRFLQQTLAFALARIILVTPTLDFRRVLSFHQYRLRPSLQNNWFAHLYPSNLEA